MVLSSFKTTTVL